MNGHAVPAGKESRITVVPTGAPVGAEILGVDLSKYVLPRTIEEISRALGDYGIIFFRNQNLTPEQHIRFSRSFGELESLTFSQYTLPGFPQILLVSNIQENGRDIGISDAGKNWHSDSSYVAMPSPASLMYAVEVPVENGESLGNTLFVPVTGIYENLPREMKERLANLKAIHRMPSKLTNSGKPAVQAIHPVIRTHPTTGRKCIYINEGITIGFVGVEENEGKKLLRDIVDLLISPMRIYRHRWKVGDLVIWDNCSTQHHATFDYSWPRHRRLMHRTRTHFINTCEAGS